MALLLVVILMALATCMAYSLLASQTTQAAAAANLPAAAQADALAESGAELAMYYIQHPKNAPTLTAASGSIPAYWPGNSSVSFYGLSGTANVTITPDGATGALWNVSSTATNSALGSALSKTVSGIVSVPLTFQAPEAVATNVALTLPSSTTVNGTPTAFSTTSTITVNASDHVTGKIAAANVIGGYSSLLTSPPTSSPVPDYTNLQSYSTYTYQGHSETASTLVAVAGTYGAVAGNLAGVYQKPSGNVTLTGPMTINGTIYVKSGNLNISGAVVVNPTAGFPAVIVNGNVNFTGASSNSLTANGSVFLEKGIGTSNASTVMTVTGNLLIESVGISGYTGQLVVNYNASDASVPTLTSTVAYLTPLNAKLITWNP